VTHQIRDAFYVATHQAVRTEGRMAVLPLTGGQASRADFMVLHDGRICFEGTGSELLSSPDAYLREFLRKTLPPW
jgi:ABC-type transporter Mla maintaining outer membrane lipid asymmetry ATPase subunit MlaF